MVLPLASGEEGDGDEEAAGRREAEGFQIAETLREALLFLFVYRNEVTDGLPDLFAVVGVARAGAVMGSMASRSLRSSA